jgi:hypothetical protein
MPFHPTKQKSDLDKRNLAWVETLDAHDGAKLKFKIMLTEAQFALVDRGFWEIDEHPAENAMGVAQSKPKGQELSMKVEMLTYLLKNVARPYPYVCSRVPTESVESDTPEAFDPWSLEPQ